MEGLGTHLYIKVRAAMKNLPTYSKPPLEQIELEQIQPRNNTHFKQ